MKLVYKNKKTEKIKEIEDIEKISIQYIESIEMFMIDFIFDEKTQIEETQTLMFHKNIFQIVIEEEK